MKLTSLDLLPLFNQFIKVSQKGKRTKYRGRMLSKGTIVQYQCVYQLLKTFEQRKQNALRVVLLKKYSFEVNKKEKKYWDQFFYQFTTFLYKEKNCYDGYVCSVCKVLQTFFNYLKDEKHFPIGNFHKQFKVSSQQRTPIILEPIQLQFLIHDKAFEEALSHSLKRTKDIFVFGCTVGLRYSDLMRLRKEHLINAPSENYLLIHTKKTNTEVKIPLPHYLLSIIERYKKGSGSYLLPRLSSTNINLQVKQLMEKAGWTHRIPKIMYRQGKPIEIKTKNNQCQRFCDQVTSHTMRRTAITTLLTFGVSVNSGA